jgi:hypothetical protein
VLQSARSRLALVAIASTCACLVSCNKGNQAWREAVARVEYVSDPDSTAVLVLFDNDLFDYFRSRLPRGFRVIPFRHPDVPRHDAFSAMQLGQMYREAAAATRRYPVVWVVGIQDSPVKKRAAAFARVAVSSNRDAVRIDTLHTDRGTLALTRWVDRPGGVAWREEMARSQAWAESVITAERSKPPPTPITHPFSAAELEIDADTLSYFVAKLRDTSYYSIGGCSDVETIQWDASERLGAMGPGVVPALVDRIDDPNPFVRERVQDALLFATQDERIMARTGNDYLRFYDQPDTPPAEITRKWWSKYRHFWASADTTRQRGR